MRYRARVYDNGYYRFQLPDGTELVPVKEAMYHTYRLFGLPLFVFDGPPELRRVAKDRYTAEGYIRRGVSVPDDLHHRLVQYKEEQGRFGAVFTKYQNYDEISVALSDDGTVLIKFDWGSGYAVFNSSGERVKSRGTTYKCTELFRDFIQRNKREIERFTRKQYVRLG